MDTVKEVLSKAQIERDMAMSFRYIQTASSDPDICGILNEHGYNDEVQHECVKLFMYLVEEKKPWFYRGRVSPVSKEAIKALNAWDKKYYPMAKATLEHLHVDQATYVFDGLPILNEIGAAASIKAFLGKIGSLRDGTDPDREDRREEDLAAVLALEARNIVGAEIETRLEGLIADATRITLLPEKDELAIERFYEVADKHHAWIRDWHQMARAAIKNRRYLMQLGVLRRRKKKPVDSGPGNAGAGKTGDTSGGGSGSAPCGGTVNGTCPYAGNTPGAGAGD